MATMILVIAVLITLARPGGVSSTCSTEEFQDLPTTEPTKTYISSNGQPFPWHDLRLPTSVTPQLYNIFIHPNISESWFKGEVEIHLFVEESTDFFVLHSAGLTISNLTMNTNSGKRILEFLEYPSNEQVYVQLPLTVERGQRFSITVTFNRSFADLSEMSGFYKSSYQVNEETRYMASTHFESVSARKAFPCFDEPSFKAKFTLHIVREKGQISLYNTQLEESEPYEQDLVLDRYKPSVRMSTYLVAFVVCDFKHISQHTKGGVKIRMFAPEDKIEMGRYALDVAVKVLDKYDDFFGVPYPLPKMDIIGIPNFAAGAMENWGLVTFRSSSILYDKSKDSVHSKQWVTVVVAHELAHQWFGDLVTMQWWNDLWLNEGFASFVEYIGADSYDSSFRMMDEFSSSLTRAMYMDSFTSAHPIEVPVHNPADIEGLFDDISYYKGASLIRMLKDFLGDHNFKRGLTHYLTKFAYQNACTQDLWDSLQEFSSLPHGLSVSKVMNTWTKQMNFPVVRVTRSQGHLLLTQERFLLSGSSSEEPVSPYNYTWHIPFSFKTSQQSSKLKRRHYSIRRLQQQQSRNKRQHFDTTIVWMKRGETKVKLADPSVAWVKGNVDGKGYYRVMYCDEGWKALTDQLMTDHSVLTVLDRFTLVSDVFSLARSGHVKYDVVLNLTTYLSLEQDYFVWKEAATHLNFIKDKLSDVELESIKKFMLHLVLPHYERLGWRSEEISRERDGVGDGERGGVKDGERGEPEDHVTLSMRALMVSLTLELDHPPAVKKALELFKIWMNNGSFDAPNELRGLVYSTGVKYGNSSVWRAVLDKFKKEKTPSEKEKLLSALTASRDASILEILLEMSLTGSGPIKSQDTGSVISGVAGNTNGRLLAWRFFRRNWETMFSRYGTQSFILGDMVVAVTKGFNSQFDYDEIKTFFSDKQPGTAAVAVRQALETVATHVTWMNTQRHDVISWLTTNKHIFH